MTNLITILGPTASGKTSFAANLAYQLDTEIISGDSRQVYRGMDLGTGKDLADYTVNGKNIKYHLVDIMNAGEKYNVFRYQKDFFEVFGQIDKTPILCGGTGLYIEAVIRNYQLIDVPANHELRRKLEQYTLEELKDMLAAMKTLHNTTDTDTKKRAIRGIEIETFIKENPKVVPSYPKIDSLVFGVKNPRSIEREKIKIRLDERLRDGMVEEIRSLIASGVKAEDLIYYGLEYKYVTLYAIGKMSYDEMREQLYIAICQFAKRQMTWFRRMERMGVHIHWIDGQLPMERKIRFAKTIIEQTNNKIEQKN
ncbi:MAG: tRNA (adenosine(37)-N6)-dimethylallyltransferase MiaA [Bacteroidales bacterium]|nr:tRNA (adenosine(37)-N6)-dimethylallyltransferase MiaA [Bacteroidales bacterium]